MQRTPIKRDARLILLFSASLLFSGCKFIAMDPLTITKVCPDSGVVDTSSLKKIDVYFSADANKGLAQSAFSLLENGVSVNGCFAWSGSEHLSFYPFEPFNAAATYTIKVNTTAEDSDGNSLKDDFVRIFRATADSRRPAVTEMTPADYARIGDRRPVIKFKYSEAMDVSSVISVFNISPSADGYLAESADKTAFQYVLTKDLAWQTQYTITIPESVKDANGNSMGKKEKYSFFVGDESIKPELLSVIEGNSRAVLLPDSLTDATETVTRKIEKDARLSIRFSESMDRDTVKNNLTFTPAINYTVEWNAQGDTLTITPAEYYAYDTVYCLTVGKACADLQGTCMKDNALYKFQTDGPKSRPPTVVKVKFLNCFTGTDTPFGTVELSHLGSIDYAAPYCANETMGFFDVYIELAETASISGHDFIDAFSISATNASVTPEGYQLDGGISFLADKVPVDSLGTNVHVIRYIVAVNNSGSTRNSVPGNIVLRINEGFEDSLKNKIGAEWSMYINTTN